MCSTVQPLYDVTRSFADNYEHGPFGRFASVLKHSAVGSCAAAEVADDDVTNARNAHHSLSAQPCSLSQSSHSQVQRDTNSPTATFAQRHTTFLGQRVRMPFGIPAGPLLNSRFTTAAFRCGFDLVVYKTVRSRWWPCNDFPNVLAVHPDSAVNHGMLDPLGSQLDDGLLADANYCQPLSISNSFGVPSQDPDVWQPDMRRAIAQAGSDQILIASFQGSRLEGASEEDYIADHAATAKLVLETGATMMEMNTSCPNEGHDRLLCHNPELVGRICRRVKEQIGDVPLIVKLGYLPSDEQLQAFLDATVAQGVVQALSVINTLSARLVTKRGDLALGGRERSGVCGNAIRAAGLNMVKRLDALRETMRAKHGADFAIIGVGGVLEPEHYVAYRDAGADAVMSATGAMWDSYLAERIYRHVHN